MTRTVKSLPIGALIVVPNSVHNGSTPVFRKLADDHHASGTTLLDTRDIIDLIAFDGKEPTNSNGYRKDYGNNNYGVSNIRKYLNSVGPNWYTPQHTQDAPPNAANVSNGHGPYDKRNGFLSAFPAEFVELIVTTTLTTVVPNTDGAGVSTQKDKVFLLSSTEVWLGNEREAEGKIIPFFKDNASRLKKPTQQALDNTTYTTVGLAASNPWVWLLRSPLATDAYQVRTVDSSSVLGGRRAYHSDAGVAPALNLPSDTLVSDTPNTQGYYEIVLAKPITLQLNTPDGQTFFEGDNLVIDGKAHSPNKGDVVIIKARLADSAIINLSTQVSDGEPFNFSQTLVFKQGRFMQGNTPVTGVLKEGDSYSLQVWAEDNKGAKSNIEKRTFGSVPNRPPVVNVTKTPSFTNASRTQIMSIEGTATDPDGDKVTVTIKHDSKPIITLPLADSKWSHTFLPGDLNVGANTFVITATDDKGLSHTKTVRINNKKYVSDMTHVPLVSLLDVDLEGVESDGGLLWIRRASDKTEYSARISTTDKKDASFIVADKASHIVNGMPRDQFTGETGVKSKRVTFEVTAKGAGSVTMIQGVVK